MAKIINIEDIAENMILAEPVVNKFGQTLISSGTQLTERHKSTLKTWNIKVLMVKSNAEDEVSVSEEMLAHARERITSKMDWTPQNPLEEDLLNAATLFVALRFLKEPKGNTD